jgi:hypothetical protein
MKKKILGLLFFCFQIFEIKKLVKIAIEMIHEGQKKNKIAKENSTK